MRIKATELPLQGFSWSDLVRAYWQLLGSIRWKWLGLMSCLFAINFYALVPPLIVGKIVDVFTVPGRSITQFYVLASILGVSFITISFLRLTVKYRIGNLQSEVIYQTKVRGFEKLLDFSLGWHLEESAGVKAQRVISGVESYRILNHRLTNEIMRSVTSIIGVVGVFLFLRPPYVLFFAGYVVGFWIILKAFYRKIHRENESYFLAVEKAGGSYVEGLSNILTIKTLGANSSFRKHIATKEDIIKQHDFTIRRFFNGMWKSFHILNGICYGSFLYLVGRDVLAQLISAGSLVIFYGYLQSLIGNASDMIDTYETTVNAKSGIGRMMSIFWMKVTMTTGKKRLSKHWDNITLDAADFTYMPGQSALPDAPRSMKETPRALANVTLAIPRAAKIGVVGKTGSGKSTLAKVLAGLYPLSSGTYTIGGTSFYELTHEEQTTQLTLVLQETEIFNLSLIENITLLHTISSSVLEKALRIAQLDEVVEKLSDGLQTLVGEKGYHLSGGERQRVGIARAICKNSPILILDEATSSLDSKTERRIQEALEKELDDKTIISIAHRVSTLEKTDQIYVFSDGAIVESGTFQSLSKDPKSTFYDLYHSQSSSQE